MSSISTHVLDTGLGQPAANLTVVLECLSGLAATKGLTLADTTQGASTVFSAKTSADGRIGNLASGLVKGTYRMIFETGDYFKSQGKMTFYPFVTVVFEIADDEQHYHVPLLISAYGYSTYRGS